jgi:hypothetical protein
VLLTRAPLYRGLPPFSCDLHVLGAPLTFVLSQDQTLQKEVLESGFSGRANDSVRWLCSIILVYHRLAPLAGCPGRSAAAIHGFGTHESKRTIQFSRTEGAWAPGCDGLLRLSLSLTTRPVLSHRPRCRARSQVLSHLPRTHTLSGMITRLASTAAAHCLPRRRCLSVVGFLRSVRLRVQPFVSFFLPSSPLGDSRISPVESSRRSAGAPLVLSQMQAIPCGTTHTHSSQGRCLLRRPLIETGTGV